MIAILTKDLLIRDKDVQVIHGFDSKKHVPAYLESNLFNKNNIVTGPKLLREEKPEIHMYTAVYCCLIY